MQNALARKICNASEMSKVLRGGVLCCKLANDEKHRRGRKREDVDDSRRELRLQNKESRKEEMRIFDLPFDAGPGA